MKYYMSSYLKMIDGVLWSDPPLLPPGYPQPIKQPVHYDDQEDGDVVMDGDVTIAKLVEGVWEIQYTKPTNLFPGPSGSPGSPGASGLGYESWPQKSNVRLLRGEPQYGINTWETSGLYFLDLLTGDVYSYESMSKTYRPETSKKINLVRSYV